jgi:glycosyltransferase involved in cell wall biosynthesis
MASFSLSVVMPAHNEARTIAKAVRGILSLEVPYPIELIVVDDGSTDDTAFILRRIEDPRLVVHRLPSNLGKGAAVLSGAALATGTHMVIFDADAEYMASDIPRLARAIISGRSLVVFGTRMFGMNTVYQSFRHAVGNKLATLTANVLFDSCISDMHTCLKMMPISLFRELKLTHTGFGLDTEITAELLRRGHRPFEVPVSYVSRSYAEGKKLRWQDGWDCLVVLLRVRLRPQLRGSGTERVATVIDLVDAESKVDHAKSDQSGQPDELAVVRSARHATGL